MYVIIFLIYFLLNNKIKHEVAMKLSFFAEWIK